MAGASIAPTMVIELPVVLVIATVALLVAVIVAQRAGEHAARQAGRPDEHDLGRSWTGTVVDRLGGSALAAVLRKGLGRPPATRTARPAPERPAALDGPAAAPDGPAIPRPMRPARLVVAGGPRPPERAASAATVGARPSLSVELLAGALGVVVIAAVIIGIWPRETGDVLSATGTPRTSISPSPSPVVEVSPP